MLLDKQTEVDIDLGFHLVIRLGLVGFLQKHEQMGSIGYNIESLELSV